MFAHLLHLGARDWDDLTVEEIDEYCDYVDKFLAKQEEGS